MKNDNYEIKNIIPNAVEHSTLDENNDLKKSKNILKTEEKTFAKMIENSNNFKRIDDSTVIICVEKSGIPRLVFTEHQTENIGNVKEDIHEKDSKVLLTFENDQQLSKENQQSYEILKELKPPLIYRLSPTPSPSMTSISTTSSSVATNRPRTRIPRSKSPAKRNTKSRNLSTVLKNNDSIPLYARKKSLQSRYHTACQN